MSICDSVNKFQVRLPYRRAEMRWQ